MFCGSHKFMTLKYFKITNNSIIRGSSFFFNIKPQQINFDCIENNPPASPPTHCSPNSTDDQTKSPATFCWYLIFYVKI